MGITWMAPAKEVFDRVQLDFTFSLSGRLKVISELEKYRYKEDESVWKQKRGTAAYQYEVYFDDEFVCFFGADEGIDVAYLKVLEGLLKLYKEKKIFWNKELYDVYYPKTKPEEIKLPEATTPEEKIVREVYKRQAKRKGKRVKPAK